MERKKINDVMVQNVDNLAAGIEFVIKHFMPDADSFTVRRTADGYTDLTVVSGDDIIGCYTKLEQGGDWREY